MEPVLSHDQLELMDSLLKATAPKNLSPAYIELGRLDPEAINFGSESLIELLHLGKKWWQSQTKAIRESICRNGLIRSLTEADGDERDLILTIVGLLASPYGIEHAIVIAVLLVRMGVGSYCDTLWAEVERHES